MPGRGGRGIDYRYIRTVPQYLSNDVPILRFNKQQHQNPTGNVNMNISPSPTEKQDDSLLSDDEYDGYYSPLKDNYSPTVHSKNSQNKRSSTETTKLIKNDITYTLNGAILPNMPRHLKKYHSTPPASPNGSKNSAQSKHLFTSKQSSLTKTFSKITTLPLYSPTIYQPLQKYRQPPKPPSNPLI